LLLLGHTASLSPTSYRFAGATLDAGIGSRSLSPNRQTVAMPDTTIATNLNKSLDIKVNLFSGVTLNSILPVNNLSELVNLIFSEMTYPSIWSNIGPAYNALTQARTNAIDILQ
jgi:hypothetical protein